MSDLLSRAELLENGCSFVRRFFADRFAKLSVEAGRENDLDEIGVDTIEQWINREGTVFASIWSTLRILLDDDCKSLVDVDRILGENRDQIVNALIGSPGEERPVNPVLRQMLCFEDFTPDEHSKRKLFTPICLFSAAEYVELEFLHASEVEKAKALEQRFKRCSELFRRASDEIRGVEG